jgi:uncharacterized protein YciI
MLYAIQNSYKPGSDELRLATREAHLSYLNFIASKVYMAGPLIDERGNATGNIVILTAADAEEAKALADADPYTAAGLFASTTIAQYRAVYEKYQRVGS